MATGFEGTYVFTSKAASFKDEDALLVWRWEGEDALSQGYRFCIDLAQPIARTQSCAPLLGERATFANPAQGALWHGIVTRLQQMDEDSQYRYFQVLLEPQWTLARLDHTSRVHASQKTDIGLRELVNFTLKGCGLQTQAVHDPQDPSDSGDYRWLVEESHEKYFKTDFACQYEETAFAFLSRHLERAGVHYGFEQGTEREKMVFCSGGNPSAEELILPWRPDTERGLATSGETIQTLIHSTDLAQERAALREHFAENVALDLFSSHALSPGGGSPAALRGRRVTYGERYTTKEAGEYLAKLRAQGIEGARNRYLATGFSPRMRAGCMARISDHPQFDDALSLRVVQVWHAGSQPLPGKSGEGSEAVRTQTRWTGIPKATPFRPEMSTPVPRIPGLVTAVIESANGGYDPQRGLGLRAENQPQEQDGTRDYPYLSSNGYYRVRFHFAENASHWQHQDGQSDAIEPESAAPSVTRNSGWVRMATPYAGANGGPDGEFGMYLPLNEGTEVLVSFLNGDPDRPVIIGAVPNSDNPSLANGETESTVLSAYQDKPRPPDRVAGLVTRGGNMLGFNTQHGQQTVVLSSPVADSYMVMGGRSADQDAQGILLHSSKHISLVANSKTENIAGKGLRRVYDLPPSAPEEKPKEKKETSKNIYNTSRSFNLPWLTGETGVKLDKPSVSASVSASAAASASLSLDLALKLGASFTGVVAANWEVGFSAKTEVNFLASNRVKKDESSKAVSRKALVITDELKAGKRTEKVIRKESYLGSGLVRSESVYRNEAADAVILSVLSGVPLEAPSQASLLEIAQPTSLLASLMPSVKSPFGSVTPPPSLVFNDAGQLDGNAVSSLRLTKTEAELVGKSKVDISTTANDGTIALSAKQKLSLTRERCSVTLDAQGIQATTEYAVKLQATNSLTLRSLSGDINVRSVSLNQQADSKLVLNCLGLIKLG